MVGNKAGEGWRGEARRDKARVPTLLSRKRGRATRDRMAAGRPAVMVGRQPGR